MAPPGSTLASHIAVMRNIRQIKDRDERDKAIGDLAVTLVDRYLRAAGAV